MKTALVIAVVFVALTGVAAVNPERASISIPRASHPPRLTEILSSGQPPEGLPVTEFVQRFPHDGVPASNETVAYLSYDNANVYAVFVCKQDPKQVRAHLTRRDQLGGDDTVSISLDTFHDQRHAFVFFVNPLGVQADAISTEGQSDDFKFDAIWHSEGKVTADGFVAVIVIPFRSLRFNDAAGATWGIALGRYSAGKDELATWPHLTRRVEAWIPQFATLQAFEKGHRGHGLQIVPYAFLSSDRFLDSGPARMATQNEGRVGMDAKLTLRDQFTFDFTVNPDFSQVESDEPQVTVNQRYEVFFPERRPFFTDSAGFFDTPETLFFSRRVVDPQVGLRFTGKLGGWTLGALSMQDRAPGRLVDRDDPRYGKVAPVMVARAQYKVGSNLDAGVFVSQRSFGGDENRVISADVRWKIKANWVVSGQATRSTSVEEGMPASGTATFAQIEHSGSHLNFYSRYRDRSPDFRADLGYIPRTDVRQWRNSGAYRWRPKHGILTSFGPSLITNASWDTRGELQDSYVELPFRFNFKGTTSIAIARTAGYDFYRGVGLRRDSWYIDASTEQLRWLAVGVNYEHGTMANFFPAQGRAPFVAASDDATVTLSIKPSPRVRFDESYILSRLGAPGAAEHSSFNNHIVRTKVNYFITRRLWVRGIVDYSAVLPNSAFVSLAHEKRLGTDVMLTYLVHPGTAIYAGYSDARENWTIDPARTGRLRDAGSLDAITGRKFFVKVSYSFGL